MATAEKPLPPTPPSHSHGVETGEHDDGLSAFAPVRPRLFGIAYRMLGSAAEAEDIVQDVWLRWQSTRIPCDDNHTTVHQPSPVRPYAPRNLHRDLASRTGGH